MDSYKRTPETSNPLLYLVQVMQQTLVEALTEMEQAPDVAELPEITAPPAPEPTEKSQEWFQPKYMAPPQIQIVPAQPTPAQVSMRAEANRQLDAIYEQPTTHTKPEDNIDNLGVAA